MILSDEGWAELRKKFEADAIRTAFDVLVEARQNVQVAPYPVELAALVQSTKYRQDWNVWLVTDRDRDQDVLSMGLTLVIQIYEPNTYHPEQKMRVNHKFPVPSATYNAETWRRWLFERYRDVETHEAMEHFRIVDAEHIDGNRVYAPNHGPGFDPYTVREVGTLADKRTNYLGEKRDQDAPLQGRP